MSYSSRKSIIKLPGGLDLSVSIFGTQDTAPQVHMYCEAGHDPERVKTTTACPQCGNADRATFTRGVEAAKDQMVKVEEEKAKADHSTMILTKTNRDEVLALTMTMGKTYFVLPQPGSDTNWAMLLGMVKADPKVAYLTTWGWTAAKTNTWMLEEAMGVLVIKEIAHPNDVRAVTPPNVTALPQMIELLNQLVPAVEFTPDTYEDRNAHLKELTAKATKAKSKTAPKETDAEIIARLTALLASQGVAA